MSLSEWDDLNAESDYVGNQLHAQYDTKALPSVRTHTQTGIAISSLIAAGGDFKAAAKALYMLVMHGAAINALQLSILQSRNLVDAKGAPTGIVPHVVNLAFNACDFE